MLAVLRMSLKSMFVRRFFSYSPDRFSAALRRLGVRSGDVLMIHSSWSPANGFQGRPVEMIQALKDVVGPDGLLSMPSLTYQNESSSEFLRRAIPMDVRRSPSKMGLLTEVFRRGKGVLRSLSPTHPVLAWGARASEFVAGHEKALSPFGPGTPFSRLLEWGGKVLTIDAPFSTITFTHFIEDRIAPTLPFPLYEAEPLTGVVVDYDGRQREVPVRVLSAEANRLRRDERLVDVLERQSVLKRQRVGDTRLMLIDCRAFVDYVDTMVTTGWSFFDPPSP